MDLTKRKKDLSTNMTHEAAMDSFLGKLGLYRKPIAKDGSCLFRAVAEQVFNCQAEHPRVRKECIEFMKKNKDKFEAFVEGPFDHHLFNLRSEQEWAGQVEIHAISLLYKCDFLVYQAVDASPIKATDNNYDNKIIMLCYSNGNHYDSIYLFDHKKNLATCQSIVFEILYGKVFPQLEVSVPVNKSSNGIEQAEIPSDDSVEQSGGNDNASENGEEEEEGWTTVKSRKQGKALVKNQKIGASEFHGEYSKVPPLSPSGSKLNWEIMRSMDPDGYRNIELEVWEETKKEQQLKDQTVAASIQFKRGDKCQVKHPEDNHVYTAVIDDVSEKNCKIWIPELRERTVVSFSNLKPNEHSGNRGYRDLTGYHRKTEKFGESVPRGNDDQKAGRRRKPNRRVKGNENFERNQQEGQEDQSGRQRGEKNRRRRNGNPRSKEERKDSRIQRVDQGFFEASESASFPALPGNTDQPETEKPKPEVNNESNPAKFWSNFQPTHSADDVRTLNEPSASISPNSGEDVNSYESDQVSTEKTTVIETSSVEADVTPLNDSGEKHVSWQDTQRNDTENDTSLPLKSKGEDIGNINDNKDVENLVSSPEQETPENKVNDFQEYESIPETITAISSHQSQTYEAVNDALYNESNGNFEAVEKPVKRLVEEERLSPSFATTDNEKPQEEIQELINGVTDDRETVDSEWINSEVPPDESSAALKNHNQNNHQPENGVQSKVLEDCAQPHSTANLHSEILNGHVTYSKDPEGKDLPKDMETLRYLYNLGIQTYLYYNSVNTAYAGGPPLSPVYPMMSPTGGMYTTVHQPYQNQPMLVPHNMCQYPSMQVPSQEENRNQHRQSPGEEHRDNSGSPAYKQNMSPHHSPQYQQQAMAMYNYAQQMYATGQRSLYQNYNPFPSQRTNYQNKSNSNRQGNRKPKFHRNDNQANIKVFPVQSGYGSSDSKGFE